MFLFATMPPAAKTRFAVFSCVLLLLFTTRISFGSAFVETIIASTKNIHPHRVARSSLSFRDQRTTIFSSFSMQMVCSPLLAFTYPNVRPRSSHSRTRFISESPSSSPCRTFDLSLKRTRRSQWPESSLRVYSSSSTALSAQISNNNSEEEENNKEEDAVPAALGSNSMMSIPDDVISSSSPSLLPSWTSRLVAQWIAFVEWIHTTCSTLSLSSWWSRVQYLTVGFVAGAVLCLTVLLLPLSSSVLSSTSSQIETLAQPVTLFETILGDLQMAYVDEVDVQKLMETSVSAMLRSLDPYTEFESKQAAQDLTESIDGRYAGVGLVITGEPPPLPSPPSAPTPFVMMDPAISSSSSVIPTPLSPISTLLEGDMSSTANKASSSFHHPTISPNAATATTVTSASPVMDESTTSNDDTNNNNNSPNSIKSSSPSRSNNKNIKNKRRPTGIRVVTAFEGYAFDYGLRVGDELVAIDHTTVQQLGSIDAVRNHLRGKPGTWVTIDFTRPGLQGVQSVTLPRTVVKIRDVKLATLIQPNVGYIQLSGFASETGKEMRHAITYLQQAAIDAHSQLEGLVLDLRGNPGGLLTSAVDVASLLVPKGSDIVSAKGRGFPGVLYRSRADPLLDDRTKLAVLVNGQTASAAEIVAGAIQDLDVGVIVGADRTFGKGLVQNVQELPFDTALKFTVAKYYTPSGRCIQGINYQEGGGTSEESARFVAKKVDDKDRAEFTTRNGRVVKDGGGIEADFKVDAPKASALEVTLLRSGMFSEFASEWSQHNELTSSKHVVDEDTYNKFIAFVNQKQKDGDLQLEELYEEPLQDLKKTLKRSGYMGSEKLVDQLQGSIVREMLKDFQRYRSDISEDISQNILARYLPESMLIERGIDGDRQVAAAVKLVTSNKFDRLLATTQSSSDDRGVDGAGVSSLNAFMMGGGENEDVDSATTLSTFSSFDSSRTRSDSSANFRLSLKF